jgi:hypothetical protein
MRLYRILLILASFFLIFSSSVQAKEGAVLGIHILSPNEAPAAKELLEGNSENTEWHYVTIPLTLNDLEKHEEWQNFFDYAKSNHLIPIVRLTTRFENGAWKIPSKKDVVDLFTFLGELNWPTEKRYIIVFNEVNHANEWGNTIDPDGYAEVLKFSSNWALSEGMNYQVLPAAMDLAAPNGGSTREAFSYLNQMYAHEPRIFDYITYWNSHAYPNPGFSSSPERTEKNSVRGFIHELAFAKEKTGRDYQVFITETGWIENNATRRWLTSYYEYTAKNVWSDPRIMAVTPFVLNGAPGPFAGFSFFDSHQQPTLQYSAYKKVVEKLAEQH